MMTGSELITYLSNFPIAQSAISQISGALIAVLFMKKRTSTKEFEKLKAGEFKEVLHDLVANGEISYKDLYEASNYLEIAEKADKYYHKKKNDNHQNRDFDFFYRFYDNAGKVSDEEMQELWAKILAGEINQPGEYSLKTLLVLSSFSKTEARLLAHIYQHTLILGEKLLLPNYERYLAGNNIAATDILLLDDYGIVNFSDNMIYNIELKKGNISLMHSANINLVVESGIDCNFSVRQYPFTKAGCELATIFDIKNDDDDIVRFGKILREANQNLKFHAGKIISVHGDSMECDKINLLNLQD